MNPAEFKAEINAPRNKVFRQKLKVKKIYGSTEKYIIME